MMENVGLEEEDEEEEGTIGDTVVCAPHVSTWGRGHSLQWTALYYNYWFPAPTLSDSC